MNKNPFHRVIIHFQFSSPLKAAYAAILAPALYRNYKKNEGALNIREKSVPLRPGGAGKTNANTQSTTFTLPRTYENKHSLTLVEEAFSEKRKKHSLMLLKDVVQKIEINTHHARCKMLLGK
ncbi:hypothetical protein L3476_03695 [Paenibacillus thiaminolyticus]|uniref:hypothetical protein n=1 Tax=Paenibacillus thiaminolyticus TaxID=49283 RepID=UPI0023507807|nr:hypothetical protein [Paenibacillus thiaminolyticus]WCR27894.1 hypothetical protein L3476_03695 [Paenibacillus thiaminolyticus]